MTCSTDDLRTFYVSADVARSLSGQLKGKQYQVELHGLKGRTFYVEAPTVDAAQRIIVALVRKERPAMSDSATVVLHAI